MLDNDFNCCLINGTAINAKNKIFSRSHNFVTPSEEQISKETLYLTILI